MALVWLVLWMAVSRAAGTDLLIPSPAATLQALWQLLGQESFWQAAGLTLLRIIAGFLLGVSVGLLLALLTARFEPARLLLSPLLHIIRSAPVASFVILAMLWLRRGFLPVFISSLMVIPVVWSNVQKGVDETDSKLLEMAAVFRLSRWDVFRKIRLPSLLPYLAAACSASLGFAWKSGVAAEILCLPAISLGKRLQDAKVYLETPEVFALTAVVIVLSLLLEKLVSFWLSRAGKNSDCH